MMLSLLGIFLILSGLIKALPQQSAKSNDFGDFGKRYLRSSHTSSLCNTTTNETAPAISNATTTETTDANHHGPVFMRIHIDVDFWVSSDQAILSDVTGLHGHKICNGHTKEKFFASESSHWNFKCGDGHIKATVRGNSGAVKVHKVIKVEDGWQSLYQTFSVDTHYTTYTCGELTCSDATIQLDICKHKGKWVKCKNA